MDVLLLPNPEQGRRKFKGSEVVENNYVWVNHWIRFSQTGFRQCRASLWAERGMETVSRGCRWVSGLSRFFS